MKNMLKYVVPAILGLFATLWNQTAAAAIDAKISFETEIPKAFVCGENSTAESSDLHYKDGTRSLRWLWSAPSTLRFNDFGQLMRSFRVKGAGIMLWIYNPKAADADMRFSFETPTGEVPYRFDFHMDFTGWRACWIKYNDMPGDHASQQVSRLVISTPAGVESGELFLDRLTFSEVKLHDQITPDKQIPDNNCNLKRELWHWARLWEWEQYEYEEPLRDVTPAEKAQLDAVKSRIESIVAANMSSTNYINGTIIPRALETFGKAAIRRTGDGGIIGAPLLSNDECNRPKGELRLDDIENMLNAFALNSHINKDSKYDDDFFLVMDHAIDQGFAFGHGNGTNHHYGYNVRKIYDAMWLMRDKIAARGKTDEYVKVLAYWSGLAETRKPYVYGRDELLDSWHTLLIPKLISALMLPSEAEQYRAMKGLGVWLSGSLGFTPGTIGGIKPDGTTFHHGGFYPAYSTGAFAMIGYWCKATRGTDFILSEQARRNFKLALMSMANYTDLRDWGLGLAGRHPFGKNGRIPDADVNAFGYLAALGDLTGSGKGADPELAGAYLRLKGTDKELNSLFKKEGISAGPTPSGFFVYNYGAAGIHRSRPTTRTPGVRRSTPATTATDATRATARPRSSARATPSRPPRADSCRTAGTGTACRAPRPATCPTPNWKARCRGRSWSATPNASRAPRRSKAATVCWRSSSSKGTARTSPPGPRRTSRSSASTTGWSSSAAASTTIIRHIPPKQRFSSCGWTVRANSSKSTARSTTPSRSTSRRAASGWRSPTRRAISTW